MKKCAEVKSGNIIISVLVKHTTYTKIKLKKLQIFIFIFCLKPFHVEYTDKTIYEALRDILCR